MTNEPDLTIVSMVFDSEDAGAPAVLGALAKYVVVTRGASGCRNVDLAASATVPNRFVVVEKWETSEAQRAHLDDPVMVEMAQTVTPLLTRKPDIDLLEPISAQDLEPP
jgi:quinol monooxygenase YgiN